jgi:hypothetical protein
MARPRPRPAPWVIAVLGPFAGTALGVVSRWWMRLVTDDPEFSWNGTIFIVLAFTIVGLGHGLVWAARRAQVRRRWSTPARMVAVVLTLPMFVGAGGMMLPTVWGASLACHRADWRRSGRVAAAAIALPIPIVITLDIVRGGITLGRILGLVLMAATYVIVVRSLAAVVAPIDDGWRMRRWLRIVLIAASVLLVLLVVVSAVGVASV